MVKIERKKRPTPKNIYVSDDIWIKAKELLDEVRISRSQFIEITFRNLLRVNKVPSKELYQSVMDDLWKVSRDNTVDELVKIEKEVLAPLKKRKTKPKKEG